MAPGPVRDVSLALDAQGQMYVAAWHDGGTARAHLGLTRQDATGWTTVAVVHARGAHCTLAIDSAGLAHIAYLDLDRAAVEMARGEAGGGAWVVETVAENAVGLLSGGPAVALRADGRPEVCFADDAGTHLAIREGAGTWSTGPVPEAGRACNDVALALDPADERHLLARDPLADRLVYVPPQRDARALRSWEGGAGFLGDGPALAVDSNGLPHLACWTQDGIVHSSHGDNGQWVDQVVIPDGSAGPRPSLSLDAEGRPVVACANAATGAVEVARDDGTGWQRVTVGRTEEPRGPGQSVSLVIDADGAARVAYVDVGSGLSVASLAPAVVDVPLAFTTPVDCRLSGLLLGPSHRRPADATVGRTPVESPRHGSLVLQPSGRFTYTPDRGFVGTDGFGYQVLNAGGRTTSGLVVITVEVSIPITVTSAPLRGRRRSSVVVDKVTSKVKRKRIATLQRRQGMAWVDVRRAPATRLKSLVTPRRGEWGTGSYRLELRHPKRGYAVVRSETFELPPRRGVRITLAVAPRAGT